MLGMKTLTPTSLRQRAVLVLLTGVLLGLTAAAAPAFSQETAMKIRLTVGAQVATATLYDNATAKDFASLLPLSLTMTDYATIERAGMAPVAGELTHYAPWGNLAIFIEPRSFSRSLLPLGKVEEGLSILAQPGPYLVRIERIEP